MCRAGRKVSTLHGAGTCSSAPNVCSLKRASGNAELRSLDEFLKPEILDADRTPTEGPEPLSAGVVVEGEESNEL